MGTRDKEKAKQQYRSWYARNKEAKSQYDHDWNLQRRYGITRDDYLKMLLEQGGVCAICKTAEAVINKKTGTFRLLAVDHCHTTGKVRGLLCSHCNHAIGKFKDNVDILKSAISYLEKSQ